MEPLEEGGEVWHLVNTPVEVDFVTAHSDCVKFLRRKEKKAESTSEKLATLEQVAGLVTEVSEFLLEFRLHIW